MFDKPIFFFVFFPYVNFEKLRDKLLKVVVDDRVIEGLTRQISKPFHVFFFLFFFNIFYQDMNRRQDSRMIIEMKEQLRRLQERRQELESRQADEEEVFGQSMVPHLSRVMRYLMSAIQDNWFLISNNIRID